MYATSGDQNALASIFEYTLHEPFMAASMSGHLSLQFLWVLKALFTLLESTLVKIELLYALIFKM